MTRKIDRLWQKARALETRLAASVERTADRVTRPARLQPLELVHAVVDEIAAEVQPAGRGQYTFPFDDVRVAIAAATPKDDARLRAICEAPPTLRDRIVERLAAAGCASPALAVAVTFVAAAAEEWEQPHYHVVLARLGHAARAADEVAARIELIVTRGVADRDAYVFSTSPILIGRGAEVRDHRQFLVRVNHVAFAEIGDDVNGSVSRCHAHIQIGRAAGSHRIVDDGSAQGTSVIRHGRGIAVPRGSHGLTLQPGDEIAIGEARLRLRIPTPPDASH